MSEAIRSISLLVNNLPNVVIGAGTVLNANQVICTGIREDFALAVELQVDEVHAVGGKLIVSPNMDEEVIRRTKDTGCHRSRRTMLIMNETI